jgi:hypothetical protein
MSSPRPFVDALGDELYAAAVRRTSPRAVARRQRRRVLAPLGTAAAAVAVVAGTLIVVAGPDTAQAAVQVEVADGRVVITLVDLEQRPEAIEAELAEAGLDVSIVAVPVGPSTVGRFVGDVATELPPELHVTRGGRTAFSGFSLPLGWPGSLELHVGRAARDGEAYAAVSDAFAPGEPLACSEALGGPAQLALALAQERGLTASFLALLPGDAGWQRVDAQDVAAGPFGAWVVMAANATSADDVVVRIQDAGAMTGQAPRPRPPC